MELGTWRQPLQADGAGDGEICAFVGPGVALKGSIRYEGSVRIDGTLEGEIYTEGSLIVGRDAVLHATINAGVLVCEGSIMGMSPRGSACSSSPPRSSTVRSPVQCWAWWKARSCKEGSI